MCGAIDEDLKPLGAIAEDPCVVGRLKDRIPLVLSPITHEPNDYNVDIGHLKQS